MIRAVAVLLAASLALPAFCQQPLSSDAVSSVVNETIRLIRERYVFPEKAGAIVSKIESGRTAGRYAVAVPAQLATRLTEDMQAVTGDKHMNVAFDPSRAATLLAMRSPSAPRPSGGDFFAKLMTTTNFGIPEMKILPGNVRLVSLEPAFLWDPKRSPQAIDAAMRFLDGGDAYILDVRNNKGGSPDAVRYVISHFMEPGQKLMTYRMGPDSESESRSEKTTIGRLPAKPLYVLTSPGSASASEEFVAHVKNFKLGTLVGATTAGAGHRNATFGTPEGFVVSVSVGTAIHPVTNAGWEGTGVAADIAVPPAAALDAAHFEALKTLRAASTEKNPDVEHAFAVLSARRNPVRLSDADLRAFTGSYGPERKVTLRDGRLFWHFGASEFELLALGSDRFAFVSGPPITLQFQREAQRIQGVTELMPNGKSQPFARSAS